MKLFDVILFFGTTILAIFKKYDEGRWFMLTTMLVRYRKGN